MNVLVVCKLGDNTVKENVILPILASNMVSKVYVLRDMPAESFDSRVVYLTGNGESKSKWRHIAKFLRGFQACRKYGIGAIIGVLDIPHGLIGRTIGWITNIPYIHMTIAGHREFWLNGPTAEKLKLKFFGSGFAITVTGDVTKKYLINKGVSPDKLYILPNLPDERISEVQTSLDKDYDIVSFSRIDANKNVGLLIEALAELKTKALAPKVAIAGSGDKIEEIKSLAKKRQVDDQIDFLGYVSGFDNKVRLLTRSRIFISCSKGEGFPVSLIEAMNCGCVPVVTNVGDISDVVHNDVNGFIFDDFNDSHILADYIEKLIVRPELSERLSREALKVREKISVSENGKIWKRIFTKEERDCQ